MEIEEFEYNGYQVRIIYQPFFDDFSAKSKQNRLIISYGGKELINRYGLTRSGAICFYKNWIHNTDIKNKNE